MPKLAVQCLTVGPIAVNCYIVENTETHECFLVDVGAEPERIIANVGNRSVAAVLLTHGHFDHIGAVDAVCAHFGAPLYMHPLDMPKLTDAAANVSALFGAPLVQHAQARAVEDGEGLTVAGVPLEVLHTPGHTAGGVCYLLPENQGILTGDTLFADGYGRTDFPDGDFGALMGSLKRFMRLTPPMTAYPGHGGYGRIGRNAAEE